ncbi:SRPBCC domain-containing protein [Haloechinothrix sp. LS1_15]|uniref:SRPBCC family protein n=1 Tax=Haloechinothrix sp. LS1_15 TaxID=2652248 RepID=UPI0029460A32|nr:SRPBCC domain-containing protein [Haloechinothrix sp. LS1_15]MDV6012549.1 SRPBCC domain-containing protein [Haloechinothrix sp. LS1_15]
MADDDAEPTLARVSSSSVRAATGQGWQEWLGQLDAAGASGWSHKEIVTHLNSEHPEISGWWHQTLAVGYEQARGKRVAGQTADAGFQVGVRKTVPATPTEVWRVLTERPELWLGEGVSVTFQRGERYTVQAGPDGAAASGEIRVAKPGDRLRFTWQPQGWASPATVQLALTAPASGKTAVQAHVEKLPDADARERSRTRWRDALERIAAALG